MSFHSVVAQVLGETPLARPDAPFALVEVQGPDAGDFLQRLCSQDVLALAAGGLAPAAFLDAKGKLLVTCLVFRLGGSFWFEVQREQRPRLLELLERYHFGEKLAIAQRDLGPCHEHVFHGPNANTARAQQGDGIVGVQIERRGLLFTRTHGGTTTWTNGETGDPWPPAPMSPAAAECLRMAAGFVRVGIETEPNTLALEADLGDHCSTTKGCYTGQEIVARIHTYGHTNRKLCFLRLAAGDAIAAPAPLCDEDEIAVGRVMHAVPVPGQEMRCGLGYLPKDFQAPGTQLRLGDGVAVTVLW